MRYRVYLSILKNALITKKQGRNCPAIPARFAGGGGSGEKVEGSQSRPVFRPIGIGGASCSYHSGIAVDSLNCVFDAGRRGQLNL